MLFVFCNFWSGSGGFLAIGVCNEMVFWDITFFLEIVGFPYFDAIEYEYECAKAALLFKNSTSSGIAWSTKSFFMSELPLLSSHKFSWFTCV